MTTLQPPPPAAPVRAVIFDMGGVLVKEFLSPFLGKELSGGDKEHGAALKAANKPPWNRWKVDETYSEAEYWTAVIAAGRAAAVPGADEWSVETLSARVRQRFRPSWAALAVAERLRRRHPAVAVGILSNHTREWFSLLMERYSLAEIFGAEDAADSLVIASCAVRCAKPSAEIFAVLRQRLEARAGGAIAPGETLFFDDKQENVDAARAAGFHAHLWNCNTMSSDDLVAALLRHGLDVREAVG